MRMDALSRSRTNIAAYRERLYCVCMWGEGWVGWVGGKSDEGHIERWRKSRDERHDPTHLDGARRGPLAVDQQHVVWRELELAVSVMWAILTMLERFCARV